MKEPDWSQLPAKTPMRVRVLLQRCLQRDVRQRLQAMGDARISLEEVLSGAPEAAPSLAAFGGASKPWWLWAASGFAGLLLLATALSTFLYFHQKAPARQVSRYEIPLPEQLTGGGRFALSPDGRTLAFIGTGADVQSRLWVRSLETLESHPLDGTEGVIEYPFWSPDSRTIAFFAQGKLKRIEVSGGPAATLCDAPSLLFGGAWNRDGQIVFGSGVGLRRAPASGGAPSPLTVGGVAANPSFLPDGRHFVYLRATATSDAPIGVYVGSLDAKPQEQPSKPLLTDYSIAFFTPSADGAAGYLLFVRGAKQDGALGTLMAQPFDARRLELTGEAAPIAEHVSNVGFSVSATNDLVYMAGGGPALAGAGARGIVQGQLTWFDREGRVLGIFGDPGSYRTLALSPDGARVAFDRADPQNPTTRNIWLYEFARGVTTRFTFDSGYDANPVWSSDGSRIVFGSSRGGLGAVQFNLYEKPSDLTGEDELLFQLAGSGEVPSSWSPDGRFLLYYTVGGSSRVWLLPLRESAADRKPIPLDRSEFGQAWAKFSPHGRWIAYSSDESGRGEVYVRPFDAASATGSSSSSGAPLSGKWMVSKDGGGTPLWRRDGKELFYLGADRNAMAVEVGTSGGFRAGIPKALFKVPTGVFFWDVSADGQRFLMAAPSAARSQPPFTVVLNWTEELKRLVPTWK
jgi:Tol biopolymer transport system component